MSSSRPFLSLAALALLPGCAAVSALTGAAQPIDVYTASPVALASPVPATGRHIVVDTPVASGALDSDRILVKPSAYQVQYLAGARWVDPVPDLVQSLLAESLGSTGAFRYVGRTAAGPFPDYTLLTEILDFQAETTADPDFPIEAVVTLSLALVREEDGSIVASRQITAARAAASVDATAVVVAFNAAADEVLEQAVAWTLSTFGLAPGS